VDKPGDAQDDVTAADGVFPGASNGRTGELSPNRQRMQAVLRDRFGLVLRTATKELPIYALTIGGTRHKLAAPKDPSLPPSIMGNRKQITGANATVAALTDVLSTLLNTYVTNETGLDG
jgi:uncharacterized protein (TIGR03435 family)